MAIKPVLDEQSLVAKFDGLGIRPTCKLMVHASLSALGVVEGGAQTVVAALSAAVGPEGAVLMPAFRGAIRSPLYALRECQSVCPQDLCPSQETGDTGAVGEALRLHPGSVRSCNPTHTWAGIGDTAPSLLQGHRHSLTPCGTDSPFFRLMECDGSVLLLGVGIEAFTNVHAVEDARNVPYLSAYDTERRHATYTTSGRRLQYVYPSLLQAALRETGMLTSRKIGASMSHVMSARAFGSFLWLITEDDPWCLVLRPRGNRYQPFQDACAKIARMVSVWESAPDREAWRNLLEESRRVRQPVVFEPAEHPAVDCPAYRGIVRDYHRCAANDIPPWEKFEDYPRLEPGVATCGQCNWPAASGRARALESSSAEK